MKAKRYQPVSSSIFFFRNVVSIFRIAACFFSLEKKPNQSTILHDFLWVDIGHLTLCNQSKRLKKCRKKYYVCCTKPKRAMFTIDLKPAFFLLFAKTYDRTSARFFRCRCVSFGLATPLSQVFVWCKLRLHIRCVDSCCIDDMCARLSCACIIECVYIWETWSHIGLTI